MNRRGFLGFVGAGAAAIAGVSTLASAPTPSQTDDFTHNDYRVKWRDWVVPANQNILVGMWLAKHATHDLEWVSTSLGQCYPSRSWEVVDLTLQRGWPKLTPFSSDSERDTVKRQALAALMEKL